MTTINATNGELVNLVNGLFAIQDLKGKQFSIAVSRNIALLQDELKDLEKAGAPSKEFMELASRVNDIANTKDEDSKEQIDQLDEDILPEEITAKQINGILKIIE